MHVCVVIALVISDSLGLLCTFMFLLVFSVLLLAKRVAGGKSVSRRTYLCPIGR